MSVPEHYISKKKDGLPSKDDEEWVKNTLNSLTNRQTALFKRWVDCQIPGMKDAKSRLVILTPLRLLFIRKRAFGRSVHKMLRVVDFTTIQLDEHTITTGNNKPTIVTIETCPFAADNSIIQSRQAKNLKVAQYHIHLIKDIDKEFLDILQWCLHILTRGLPASFQPKLNIPATYRKKIEDTAAVGQFVIDRYVASCDAQNANRNAGIPAYESVVSFALNPNNNNQFDLSEAFSGIKKLETLQLWAISHGLAFADCYKSLLIDGANIEDPNLAILMTAFETNIYIESLELRQVAIGKKTCQTLSASLTLNNKCVLNELNIIDCHLDRTLLQLLAPAFKVLKLRELRIINCFLNNKGCQTLCNALEESGQHATLNHINLSNNHFGSSGSKALASFIEKCGSLLRLVITACELDGNEFIPCLNSNYTSKNKDHLEHLDALTYLDLSRNTNIGDKGSTALGVFLENSRAINNMKLSGCNLSPVYLQRIVRGAMANLSGFDGRNKSDTIIANDDRKAPSDLALDDHTSNTSSPSSENKRKSMKNPISPSSTSSPSSNPTNSIFSSMFLPKAMKRPTQDEILLAGNLLCMSLDLSENNLGSKGAEVLVQELSSRENYTIVGINIAKNNLNVQELSSIIRALSNLACLERVCLSENIKRGSFGKNSDSKGDVGQALAFLCRNVPNLNEIAITGDDKQSYCIDQGLIPFIETLPSLSNLEFLDVSGNKLALFNNGSLWTTWLEMLHQNRSLRVVKFFGNKVSVDQMLVTLQMLSQHSSLFEKIPRHEITLLSEKHKKQQEQLEQIAEQVKRQFTDNRMQYEIDQEMLRSLTPELRLEKELRRQVGCQFGIPIERIRGSTKFPDYSSRIPQLLVRLRDYLKAKDGFKQEGIFRLQPDGKKFPTLKLKLDSNAFENNDLDNNSVANAIKVWYRELPIKVLHSISVDRIEKCSKPEDAADVVQELPEPYKSMFEWLLDIAVEVCKFTDINRMDAKNMAVVLCPNLYETADMTSSVALVFSQSLLKFTEFAIKWRVEYRKTRPFRPADDMLLVKPLSTPVFRERAAIEAMLEEEDDDEEEVRLAQEERQSNEKEEKEKTGRGVSSVALKSSSTQEITKNNEAQVGLPKLDSVDSGGDVPRLLSVEITNVEKMENESGFVSNYKKGRSSSRADMDFLARARSKSHKRKKPPAPSMPRKGTGLVGLVSLAAPPPIRSFEEEEDDEEEEKRIEEMVTDDGGGAPRTSIKNNEDSEPNEQITQARSQLDEDDADSDEDTHYKRPAPPPSRPKKKKNINELVPDDEVEPKTG